MRLSALLAATFAAFTAAVAGAAAAPTVNLAPTPIYSLTFQGSGTEHQIDQKQNIQDDGTCDSAEHVDVIAAMAWSTTWLGFRTTTRSALASPTRVDGSRVAGAHVKDACGLPLDRAPAGWASQTSCDEALVTAGSPTLSSTARKDAIVIAVTASPFAVPVTAKCPLNVRNDQLSAHVVVTWTKLRALKRRASLTFTVGTSRPGLGDTYSTTLDCSVPTKPYEGYRTADHCQDRLSWSGTLTITRVA